MVNEADDQPIVVFEGAEQDCAFLFSLLGSSGIEAVLDSPVGRRLRRPRLLVCRKDVERAIHLIRDFEQNGKRAEP